MQVYFLFIWKLQANKVHQKYLLYTSQGSQISKISKVCSRVCFVKDLRISSQKQKSLNRTGKKIKKSRSTKKQPYLHGSLFFMTLLLPFTMQFELEGRKMFHIKHCNKAFKGLRSQKNLFQKLLEFFVKYRSQIKLNDTSHFALESFVFQRHIFCFKIWKIWGSSCTLKHSVITFTSAWM